MATIWRSKMPRKPLTKSQMQEVVDLVEECLKEGYTPTHMPSAGKGAIQEAAKRAVERGLVATTSSFRSRLFLCRERGFTPDEGLYRPNQYQPHRGSKKAPAPLSRASAEPEASS